MAGKSSRFMSRGYEIPKFLINVKGSSLLQHSVESLPLEVADGLIFILLKEHEFLYDVSSFIKKNIFHPNIDFIFLEKTTDGQAETVFMAKKLLKNGEEIAVFNIDTKFESKTLKNVLIDKNKKKDGILGAFKSPNEEDHWSFAKIGSNGLVLQTAEKEKISDYALTGFYHFSNSKLFLKFVTDVLDMKF